MADQPGKRESKKKRTDNDDCLKSPPQSPESLTKDDTTLTSPKKARYSYNFWDKSGKGNIPLKIEALEAGNYDQQLECRVSYKSPLKDTINGKMLNFNVLDATGEISVVAFPSETAKFAGMVEVNKALALANFLVKNDSKSQYTGISNTKEIHLTRISTVSACEADVSAIPFNFLRLDSLIVESKVDVLGIFVRDWGLEEVVTKATHRKVNKREISLTDMSKTTVIATLWGQEAEDFACEEFSCIALRNAFVKEYAGVNSLNCMFGTLIWVDPKIQQGFDLKKWFSEQASD